MTPETRDETDDRLELDVSPWRFASSWQMAAGTPEEKVERLDANIWGWVLDCICEVAK